MTESRVNLALWAMVFGNFVIGTGVLLPAGMLNQLSAELHVDTTTAGLLLLVGGIVVGDWSSDVCSSDLCRNPSGQHQ